jgi:hypothetical protein
VATGIGVYARIAAKQVLGVRIVGFAEHLVDKDVAASGHGKHPQQDT